MLLLILFGIILIANQIPLSLSAAAVEVLVSNCTLFKCQQNWPPLHHSPEENFSKSHHLMKEIYASYLGSIEILPRKFTFQLLDHTMATIGIECKAGTFRMIQQHQSRLLATSVKSKCQNWDIS
jgi:hypothetical protein